ncbi:DUF1631 domain-containing protein [Chitiniphilus purpureus]|uniref:DUF1631 domain-containing protein n=1 Tax=Chitiniphilus purpureus TaxID=2981137 RepID=A0ABY6DJ12_9NEIS|nr:DUF1631 domain-containing protein [Chitiniphilus sp. CD1]UXY14334.1 DUF1631 domain-containing protein [Chitiniphilus sp. CD1]
MNQARIPQPGPPSAGATLEACRDMALGLLSESLDGYFSELEEKFFQLAEETFDRHLRDVYFAARGEIKSKKEDILDAFRQQFIEAFNQRWHGEQNGSGFFQVTIDPGELALVANDDYEESLTASHVANTLKQKGGDTLSQLELRLASLLPERTDAAQANPLSPEAICQAFLAACRQLESGLGARLVALRSFESTLSDRVAGVYQSINQYLIQQDVQPRAPQSVVRRSVARGAYGASGQAATGDPGQQAPGVQTQLGLSPRHAALPGGGADPGGYTISPELAEHFMRLAAGEAQSHGASLRPEWFSFLDNLQHDPPGATRAPNQRPENLLALLRSTRWAGELNRIDTMTFDLVSMLFDRLFEDPHLANAAKGLLARLQIPVLKVALLDSGFFARKQHPARRVVDLLEDAFIDLDGEPAPDDPEFVLFSDAVAWIVDHFEDDVAAFDDALQKIERHYAQAHAEAEAKASDAAQDLIRHEVLEFASVTANALIEARLEAYADAPELVRTFLGTWWKAALTASYGPEGEYGEAFAKYVRAMDELLWSLRPKRTPEERLQLVNLLPPMLKLLEQGGKLAGMPAEASRSFFSQLVQCHAMAIRSGLRTPATEAATDGGAMPVFGAPPVANPTAAVSNLTRPMGPAAEFAALPQEQGTAPVATGQAAVSGPDEALARGDWITWEREDNVSIRLRLSWISPQGTRYLFTNRQGETGLTLTRAELLRHLESGRLRIAADEESATERAFNRLRADLQI